MNWQINGVTTMSKLYVIRRTESEMQIFGGTVFIDVDGKRVGEVRRTNLVIDLTPGKHTIKMYISHTYDTYIGFAEVDIDIESGKDLTAQYTAPITINQPGHIVVSDFISLEQIDNQLKQRENALQEEKKANELRAQITRQNIKNNNNALVFWVVFIPTIIGIIYYFVEMHYLNSLL